MAEMQDLAAKKKTLAALESEIAAQQQKFEDSIAELREQHEKLRREYADALRAELASIGGSVRTADGSRPRAPRGSRARPDAAAILAAIERAQEPISGERIRELAGIPATVSSNSMSTALRTLVDEGRVVREGQRRGTKYRIK
jgi:septal ring factor EnvC (AmiA/AmiB activator)